MKHDTDTRRYETQMISITPNTDANINTRFAADFLAPASPPDTVEMHANNSGTQAMRELIPHSRH